MYFIHILTCTKTVATCTSGEKRLSHTPCTKTIIPLSWIYKKGADSRASTTQVKVRTFAYNPLALKGPYST